MVAPITQGRGFVSATTRSDRTVDDDEVIEQHLGPAVGKGRDVGIVSRRAKPGAGTPSDDALATALEHLDERAAGQPLPDTLRLRLEQRLGHDLRGVRVHTDARAAAAARQLGAEAFTIGDDIYFAEGAYDPASERGVELVSHEVAHAVQNRSASRSAPRVSGPDDARERDADDFAASLRRSVGDAGSTDPADLVEHVRREGRQMQIPHLDEIEEALGASFHDVQAYTGDAAALACGLMSASAFAVRNIVAFADPSPNRDQLMHELSHIVQMGQRAAPRTFTTGSLRISSAHDEAEVAARSGDARTQVSVRADADTIHRDDGTTTTPPAAAKTKPKDRWKEFDEKWIKSNTLQTEDLSQAVFGIANGTMADGKTPSYDPRFKHSSKESFSLTTYKSVVKDGADHDLSYLYNGGSPTDAPGLTKVGGETAHTWAWLGPTEKYYATVVDMKAEIRSKPDPDKQWKEYSKWVEKLGGKIKPIVVKTKTQTLKPDVNAGSGTAKYSSAEADEFRRLLFEEIATAFAMKDGQWADFYNTIVTQDPFKENTGLVGNAFEQVVKKTIAGGKAKDDVKRPHFDIPGSPKDYLRHGDMEDLQYKSESGKLALVIECKAYTLVAGPDGKPATHRTLDEGLKSQARDYAKIIGADGGSGIEGFDMKDGQKVNKRKFNHCVYVFPTAEVASQWYRDLNAIFKSHDYFSLVPAPGSMKFDVTFNPTLNFSLDPKKTSQKLSNPVALHSGLKVKEVDVNLKSPGGDFASGSITFEPEFGEALKSKTPEKKQLKAAGAAGGATADNKISGLQSETLKKLLKNFSVDAKLTDDGVEATVDIKGGATPLPKLNVEPSKVTVRYGSAGLSAEGELNLAHASGKFAAKVKVGFDGKDWTFEGSADVKDLVDGLDPFKITIKYANGDWTVGCDSVKYKKKFGAIELTGTANGVAYDIKKGTFSGTLGLDADLGMFGKAGGEATLEDNKLKAATLTYDSPEFKYPAKSEKPAFAGTVGGTVRYNNGKFSGDIRGTANLNIPALKKIAGEDGAGLAVDAHIGEDGSYSGTIRTTSKLKFGKHLEIPSIACTLEKDGSVKGAFEIAIVNIKNLTSAKAKCTVDKDGLHIESAEATVEFGNKDGGKFWGEVTAKFSDAKGFDVSGTANYKIKDDITATGTIKYSQETNAISVELKVTEITLMDKKISKQLFKASKQFPIVNVYGLGIYVDIGIDLGFDFGFKLTMTPSAKVEDFSLDTMEYKRIAAKLAIGGDIYAQLTGTPKLGLGVFALDPSILRGGGGLKVPIVGRLDIKPKAEFEVGYSPSGGADASAKLGLAGEFGIKGSVKPYAEFSVLNDVWNPKWEGDALAEFEILKPTELFNFTVDLNSKEKQEDPALPGQNESKTPSEPAGDKTAKATPAAPTERGGDGGGKDTPAKQGAAPSGGDDGPFSLTALMGKLETMPGFDTAKKIFEYGKKIWAVVKPIWDLVEPLMDIIAKRIEEIISLFDPPPSADNLGAWLWKLAKVLFNLSFGGLTEIASAIRTLLGKAAAFAKKLISKAVADGHVGVKRHEYYIWRPWPWDDYNFLAAAEWKINIPGVADLGRDGPPGFLLTPSGAVSLVLYEALEAVGVGYTYTGKSGVGSPYNDIWTGSGARG